MVGALNRVQDKQFLVNLDLLPVIHQVHDQSAHIQVSEIDEFSENHFPKELRLEFLQLIDEGLQSE